MCAMRPSIAVLAVVLLASPAAAVDEGLREQARDPDSFERSDAARALGKDGSPEAARLLLELIADRNPYVRDHATRAAGLLREEASVRILAAGIRAREPLLRGNVAEALGRTARPAALPALATLATKDRSPEVRVAALDALWRFRESEAALEVCREAFGDEEPAVRSAAVEAAGRIRAEGSLELVRKGGADEDAGVRCVALMELRWVAPDEARAGLAEAAADPEWRIRAQAVDDAFALRGRTAMDALVTLVGDVRPRVAAAAHRALRALTGKEIGRDPEVWRRWWEEARDDWNPPGKRRRLEGPDGRGSAVAFQGVEVDSDRVAFVLDASGSMAQAKPGDERKRTRWEYVCDALADTLERLPDGTLVSVIVFEERVHVATRRPVRLSRSARRKLGEFASRRSPGNAGDLLAGVLAAGDQEGIDTVFLLSDGAPSHGGMVDKGRVRAAIRAVNRTRKRVIHTIAFGSEKDSEKRFMRGVAEDSGGRCVLR